MLIVDSGDLFIEKEEIPESTIASRNLKVNIIGQVYKKIGIDALNIGERDLVLGVDFLKDMEERLNLPFISANLTDVENNLLFKPYVIKVLGGKKFGIFGIVGDTKPLTHPKETGV